MRLIKLIPINTFTSKYYNYIMANNYKLVYNYYENDEIKENKFVQNVKSQFKHNKLQIYEKIIKPNEIEQQNILNINMSLKIPEVSPDNVVHEIISIYNSAYQFKINYKLALNNKLINSFVIDKNDYNNKNFDKNFQYLLNKYDYTRDIKLHM